MPGPCFLVLQEVKRSLYSFTVLTGVFAADREIEGTALYGSGAICHALAVLQVSFMRISLPIAKLTDLDPISILLCIL